MTCIVWIVDGKDVLIWWDSAWVAWTNIIIRKDPKVFKVWEFIFWCTSSFRMINILRFSFNPPKRKEWQDIYEYMCTDFVDAIRSTFKDKGYMEIDKHQESWGSFLVWVRDGKQWRLFNIEWDFQVGESVSNYNACWCWVYYALWSLFSDNSINTKNRCENALKSAAHFSWGVEWPFNFISL